MSKALVSILAGLGAMFGWGISDFFASISSENIGNRKTYFWSQISGLFLITIAIILVSPNFNITPNLFPLIFISGVGYLIGYLYFYKAFEIGNVSVVSVVINLNAVFTMLVAYVIFGQRLTGYQIPAIFMVILGILLVSMDFKEIFRNKKSILLKGAKESIIASVGFGILCWPTIDYLVGQSNWLWVTFLSKTVAVVILLVISLIYSQKVKVDTNDKKTILLIFIIGILEAVAVLSLNFGFSVGDSILISPIANSVAIVTVTMAVIFLKEKLTKVQFGGIVLTICGIVLSAF